MKRTALLLAGAALALAALAGCPASRTAAATQTMVKAFNPVDSDPKALQLADATVEKLGGWAKWNAVKQLRWEQRFVIKGEVRGIYRHSWDRWNGRHRMETADLKSLKEAEEQNNERLEKYYIAMYDLFDHDGKGSAYVNDDPVMQSDRDKMVAEAYKRWQLDAFLVSILFRLRDPGVKLSLMSPRKDDFCPEGCDVIKVSFDPAIGKDVYHIDILQSTGMPFMIEIFEGGGPSPVGYKLEDWTEVGGLKFPQRHQNVAADEQITFKDIKIDEPEDELYIPRVM